MTGTRAELRLGSWQTIWRLAAALVFNLFFFSGLAALASSLAGIEARRLVLPVLLLAAAAWLGMPLLILFQRAATGVKSRARRFGAAICATFAIFIAAGVFSLAWVGGPPISTSLRYGGAGMVLALVIWYFGGYLIITHRGGADPAQ